MQTIKRLISKCVIVLIIITGFQCAAAVVAPVFVALIGAKQWTDKSALPEDHNFFFFGLTTPDSNYSTFTGNEFAPGLAGAQPFTGHYLNHDIEFTYDDDASAERAGKTYKGTINDASTEITLKGSDASNPLPAVTLTTQ